MVVAPTIAPPAAEGERQERTGTPPRVEVWDAIAASCSHGEIEQWCERVFEFWVEKDLKKEGVFCFFG